MTLRIATFNDNGTRSIDVFKGVVKIIPTNNNNEIEATFKDGSKALYDYDDFVIEED